MTAINEGQLREEHKEHIWVTKNEHRLVEQNMNLDVIQSESEAKELHTNALSCALLSRESSIPASENANHVNVDEGEIGSGSRQIDRLFFTSNMRNASCWQRPKQKTIWAFLNGQQRRAQDQPWKSTQAEAHHASTGGSKTGVQKNTNRKRRMIHHSQLCTKGRSGNNRSWQRKALQLYTTSTQQVHQQVVCTHSHKIVYKDSKLLTQHTTYNHSKD